MRQGDTLHTENQETCTTYNMLKVGLMPLYYLFGYMNNILDFFGPIIISMLNIVVTSCLQFQVSLVAFKLSCIEL
jgi:hypothetical protein